MANIPETASDYQAVEIIEPEEYVLGGIDGTANKQAKSLVARDNYLKKQIEDLTQDTAENLEAVNVKVDTNTEEIAKIKSQDIEQVKAQTVPLGAIMAFPKAITNPAGFLKCDGSQFNQETYPDLYQVLGNCNILPNLNRTDIGQLAYFPFNEVPAGWIEFDKLKETLETDSENKYAKLKEKISAQFGGLDRIPKSENRFIRGLGNNLQIGQVQGDAIRNIKGEIGSWWSFGTISVDNKFIRLEGGTSWRHWYASNGGHTSPQKLTFNASRVVPTAEENRPVAIAFKLCIKALDTAEDVDYWIKAASGVVNEGLLDASTLAQDIQEQRTALSEKADLVELEKLKKPLKAVKIWEGNVQKNNFNNAISVDFSVGDVLFLEMYANSNPPTGKDANLTWTYDYFTKTVEVMNTEAGYQLLKNAIYKDKYSCIALAIYPREKKIAILDNNLNLYLRRISKLIRG